jgi:superfamily II DNA or RNA helicase
MSFRDLSLNKAYSSESDKILHEFYIPILKNSIEYDRLAGFFSSGSLALAASGIIGLIGNGGTMRLIVSPILTKDDIETIESSNLSVIDYCDKLFLADLDKLEDEFIKSHLFALGWLMANNKLFLKIAFPKNDKGTLDNSHEIGVPGLFHPKVGIFKDAADNIITFSGSINETASGWSKNIEEFKVFFSWEGSASDYIRADVERFDTFWNNNASNVEVIEVSHAVKNKMIQIAPANIDAIDFAGIYSKIMESKSQKVRLFAHQNEAVMNWIKNDYKGIFELATGTGKTYTALECARQITLLSNRYLLVISCPYQHLIQQWKREIDKYSLEYDKLIIADSSVPLWKKELADSVANLSLNYLNNLIVLTTNRGLSSKDFISILAGHKNIPDAMIIADEVHGLGSLKNQRGLTDFYKYRLGLSATPKRWFDDIGTQCLYDYFSDVISEFGLDKAVSTINPATHQTYLTPYKYLLNFANLNNEELEAYIEKSKKMTILMQGSKGDLDKQKRIFELLLFERANIIKNADAKYETLRTILASLETPKWTIIYCSPQQIDKVMDIVNEFGFSTHRFTMNEGVQSDKRYGNISEREYLLKCFGDGDIDILVAMKCLDEGIDIPQARQAIFLSSSGNPREYVQRIGRILRRFPEKEEALVFDIIVTPGIEKLSTDMAKTELKIFSKELLRYEYIAKCAANNAESMSAIYDIRNRILR